MANNSLRADFARANPVARRTLLGAFASAPFVVGSIAMAANSGGQVGDHEMNMHSTIASPRLSDGSDSSAWDYAIQAYETAKAESDRWYEEVVRPIADELARIATRPDLHFDITATNGQTARFHMRPDDMHAYDDHPSHVFREKAASIRDAWNAYENASARLGYDEASDENERLVDILCDRLGEALSMPAPHLAALVWKLDQLFGSLSSQEDGGDWVADINTMMADARRLLGGSV